MTLRSTVSLVARRVPFIAAGYLGSCSAATFTGLFAVAMVNFVKGLAAGEVGQAIVMSIVIIMFGFIPAVISMVMMGVVPAALAVLVAELLRVRSVWIYAVAGALTGTAAYFTSWAADAPYGLGLWLPAVVPAGLVGGVVYWVIAVRLGGPPAAEKAAVPLPPHLNGPGGFPAQVPL